MHHLTIIIMCCDPVYSKLLKKPASINFFVMYVLNPTANFLAMLGYYTLRFTHTHTHTHTLSLSLHLAGGTGGGALSTALYDFDGQEGELSFKVFTIIGCH